MGLSQVPGVPSYAGSVSPSSQSQSPVNRDSAAAAGQASGATYSAPPPQPAQGMVHVRPKKRVCFTPGLNFCYAERGCKSNQPNEVMYVSLSWRTPLVG